jgi:two-component system alkaline phosphatase synthesis response regulator PhoP
MNLTPREFELLQFLARNPGRVMTRDELLRNVWGHDYAGDSRTVDVHVRRLRHKIGELHPVIETVTGSGYKLVKAAPVGT